MKRLAIVAWLATAVVMGCASQPRAPMSRAPSESSHPAQVTSESAHLPTIPAPDPREELELLDQQIDNARARMGLEEVVGAMAACSTCPVAPAEPFVKVPSSHDPTCRPASNAPCQDSCTLYDAICANADRICTLARGMRSDRGAAKSCSRGMATCHAAKEKCCSCQ